MGKFYITTSIAYTNTFPHIGYALELVQADVLARHQEQLGKEVFFLTGTDEHGAKIARAAKDEGKKLRDFVDLISDEFRQLAKILNISNNDFIRTTDRTRHWPAVVKIWQALEKAGDLYKADYHGHYCVGCERFIKPSELINGECPLHKQKPEIIEEENWFFRLTKYKKEVKQKIAGGELKILPASRANEVLGLIADAEDVSFSRPSKDLKWGIPVPGDTTSTVYVWADALTNYLSALDYANNGEKFQKYWPADIQLIGKDILRFHAIIWPTMLLSVGLPLPRSIYVHGFITVEGEKISKSLGNVIDPFQLVKKYGVDPVRYYLLREIPSNEDGDFSETKLVERYNGDLANNLGNLVSRVAKLIETKLNGELIFEEKFLNKGVKAKIATVQAAYEKYIADFKLHEAIGQVWELFTYANGYIDANKPWAAADPEHLLKTLTGAVALLTAGAKLLWPFLPETAEKVLAAFGRKLETDDYSYRVAKTKPLFPRLK